MASAPKSSPAASVLADPGERLESWKEIAAYLRRDVTTAQRWEKYEGLPVHRLQHQKLGTVYALKSEIDAWRARGPARTRMPVRAREWALVALAGLVVLAVASVKREAAFRWFDGSRGGVAVHPIAELDTSEPQPVTSDIGDEAEPAISPDGNYVAFVSNRSGKRDQYDLFLKQIGGGDPLRLTTCAFPEDCYGLAWAPDGQRLAFLRRARGEPIDGRAGIFIIPALGGAERRTGTVLASGEGLSWFPDGSAIAIGSQDAPGAAQRISILTIATGALRRFSDPPAGWFDSQPAVAPDGHAVAFLRRRLDWPYPDLLVQTQPGSPATKLQFAGRNITDIGWLPDGRELLISSGGALLRVPLAGGEPSRVPVDARVGRFSVGRSARRVVLVDNATQQDIWRVSGPAATAPRAAERAALSSTRDEARATYSPDGRRVAFVTKRSGRSEVWTCDVDEIRCGPVPVAMQFDGQDRPAWSPDSRQIVFEAALAGQPAASMYVFDFVSRTMHTIAGCPPNSRNAVWGSDGASIYFSPDEALRTGVWRVPVNGPGPARQVVAHPNTIAVADDGAYLYLGEFSGSTQRLTVRMSRISLNGGAPEQLPGSSWGRYAVWSGKIIFVEPHEDGSRSSLVLLDPVKGSRKIIADLGPLASQPTVSPDGKWVLYTSVILNRDLLLITLAP